MRYLATPSSPAVVRAMRAGLLGCITTPRQSSRLPEGVAWCADNGAFSGSFDEEGWWRWLSWPTSDATRRKCLFAVAPDVVGDHAATLERSRPWLSRIRGIGYPVAFVAQDGLTPEETPWDEFDVLFIGGTTSFKLGPAARRLASEAHRQGKPLHMGRVNSKKRIQYARLLGCATVDGTHLSYAPNHDLPILLSWMGWSVGNAVSCDQKPLADGPGVP